MNKIKKKLILAIVDNEILYKKAKGIINGKEYISNKELIKINEILKEIEINTRDKIFPLIEELIKY
jgi:hypothetical protein